MKQVLTSVEQELMKEKQAILNYVKAKVGSMKIPERNDVALKEGGNESVSGAKYIMIAGCLLLVIGIIAKSTIISILGGLVFLFGWWMSRDNKPKQIPAEHVSVVDYSAECRRIFTDVKEMHQTVVSRWDELLSQQCSKLKDGLSASAINPESVSRINDILASHAVMSFPMMDVLQELLAVGEKGSGRRINDYLEGLRVRYEAAVNAAYLEQSLKYYRIWEFL